MLETNGAYTAMEEKKPTKQQQSWGTHDLFHALLPPLAAYAVLLPQRQFGMEVLHLRKPGKTVADPI
jgi:hypothetical protein